ncbi:MAG: hypothetical protein OEV92_12750 [Nitrospinota bacterium]|nr:hypothetical protein [Nitrospinota bacterium]
MRFSITHTLKNAAVLALILLSAAACGKKNTSQNSGASTGLYPINGNVISSKEPFLFRIEASAVKNSGVTYRFMVYDDEKRVLALASTTGVAPKADGSVTWVPGADLIIEPNKAYWWEWEDSAGARSGLKVFYASSFMGSRPISPRDGGYLDKNLRNSPSLGVSNLYTGGGLLPTYDFQLFDAPDAQKPIAETAGLPQAFGVNQTRYYPPVTLNEGQTYYWRAKVNAPGVDTSWSKINSFTVANLCSFTTGGRYAAYAIDWVPKKCANVLKFIDMKTSLGPPDATIPYANFLSLDYGGEVIVEMGATVIDQPGFDMRVFEFVSTETLELFAGPTEAGPWFSLGVGFCGNYCDFDLEWAGIKYAKFFRVKDVGTLAMYCHETSGSDIDSVEWITGRTDVNACDSGW